MEHEPARAVFADSDLAARFAEASRYLLAAPTTADVLQRIVDLAAVTIDACDYAGILLAESGPPARPTYSAAVAAEVDQLQLGAGEGPCLDVLGGQDCVYAYDLTAQPDTWPRFSPGAVARGIRCVLAYRLFDGMGTLGALNLYATLPAAFGANERAVGAIYAAHAGAALAATTLRDSDRVHTDQLRQALASRETIGQAQGILMERDRITADQAFDVLRRASQNLNIKLREVAQDVVDTGAVPGDRPRGR